MSALGFAGSHNARSGRKGILRDSGVGFSFPGRAIRARCPGLFFSEAFFVWTGKGGRSRRQPAAVYSTSGRWERGPPGPRSALGRPPPRRPPATTPRGSGSGRFLLFFSMDGGPASPRRAFPTTQSGLQNSNKNREIPCVIKICLIEEGPVECS